MKSVLERATILCSLVCAPLLMSAPAAAEEIPQSVADRLNELQRLIEKQQKVIEEQQRRLSKVEGAMVTPQQLDYPPSGNPVGEAWAARNPGEPAFLVTAGGPQPAVHYGGSWAGDPRYAQAEQPPVPVPPAPVPPTGPAPPETAPTPPAPPGEAAPAPGEAPAPPAGKVEEERPEKIEKPIEELLLEAGAVLLPPGTLQIEPLVDYTHASTNRVNILGFTIFEAIVIGLIRVDEIKRDIVRPVLNVRYGLTNRIQLESSLPYVYRTDDEILGVGTAGQSEITTDNFDIGDVEFAGSYQLFTQSEWIPGTVLRMRARLPTGTSAFDIGTRTVTVNQAQRTVLEKTPTGSGFYAFAPGATFIWRSDPAVFFAGTSYTLNMESTQGNFGNIDPGDTFEFFGGINVALSDRVGMNFSFDDQITGKTVQNDQAQTGTDANDARATLGASFAVAPSVSVLTSASIGLTNESPDFVFTMSVPFNFSLF